MTHDATPVTAAQIEQLLEAALLPIKESMATKEDLMRERQKTDKQFEWLHEGIDQTLIVLGNVEKKLETKIINHEHCIKRLEKKAGLAQTAA